MQRYILKKGYSMKFFLTLSLLAGLMIIPLLVEADNFTWTGDADSASWHEMDRIDPPTPELYINNFGRIGNLPAFPGASDHVDIPNGFTDPTIWQGNVSVFSLTVNGNLTVTFDQTLDVISDVINHGTLLKAYDRGIFQFHGASFINDGYTELQYGGMFGGGILRFMNNCSLSGSGSINVDVGSIETDGSAILTHGTGHTIFGGHNSYISASIDNNGVIRSNQTGYWLYMDTHDILNNNLIESLNGSSLGLTGINVTQTSSGRLSADDGFIYFLGGATVEGGTLETANDGYLISSGGGVTNTIADITNEGKLITRDGAVLEVAGSTLVNNGAMTLEYGGMSGGGTLEFITNNTLDGSGVLEIETGRLSTSPGVVLTHGPGHLIHGSHNSYISAAITNNGTIRSDYSGYSFQLDTYDIVNNNAIESTNTSTLIINGITVSQSGGSMLADGGYIDLRGGATIQGGILDSANEGYLITHGGGVTSLIADLTNNGELRVQDGGLMNVDGTTLTNNGSILTLYGGMSGGGTIRFVSDCLLTGNGDLEIETGTLATITDVTLTNDTGHLIHGGHNSHISAHLINNGTIRSEYSSYLFYLDTHDIINNNAIESTNQSTLLIQGIDLIQSGQGHLLADNGYVSLTSDARISGGRLESANGGYITCVGGSATSTIDGITNNGDLRVQDGALMKVTGSSIINNGTLSILYGGMSGGGHLRLDNNVIFDGTGVIDISEGEIATSNGSTLTNSETHRIYGRANINVALNNLGTVEVASGSSLNINGPVSQSSGTTLTGGTWIARFFSNLTITTGDNFLTNQGRVILDGAGSNFSRIDGISSNEGDFTVENGRIFSTLGNLTNSGTLTVGTDSSFTINGTYNGSAGSSTVVDGQLSSAVHSLITGVISGNGWIDGLLILNDDGEIAPGSSVGTLNTAELIFSDESIYNWEISESDSDLISVNGDLEFGAKATLNVTSIGTVVPFGDYVLMTVTGNIGALPEWTINLPEGWITDGVEVQDSDVVLTNLRYNPSTPTPTATSTPVPTSTPVITGTPTATPTPTVGPGQVDIDLDLNQETFTGGDTMTLFLDLFVGSTDVNSVLYIVLEITGHYYFMPAFTEDPASLYTGVLPGGLAFEDAPLVIVPFPPGQLPAVSGAWHGAVLNQTTFALLDYDFVTFALY